MSEIRGIGIDLCEISRMRDLLEKRGAPPERFFTESERAYILSRGAAAADTMAGLYAAKEAFSKAVGTGIAFALTDVEVRHDGQRCPFYRLSGKAAVLAAGCRCHLSISHDGGVAGACCILESVPSETKRIPNLFSSPEDNR